MLAATALLALLGAFLWAVATAAQMGDLRRDALAAHLQATWRCQVLRGAGERADCLAQRTPIPRRNADLRRVPAPTPTPTPATTPVP